MSVLGLFLLGQPFFERKVGTLSGGEKSRLVLGVLFLRRCNFLVLDEPTNHLDLESREALIEALGLHDIDWKSIIAKTVKPAFVDINLKAFDAGMAAARQ